MYQRRLIGGIAVTGMLVGSGLASASVRNFDVNFTCGFPLIGVQPINVVGVADIPDLFVVGETIQSFVVDTVAELQGTTRLGLTISAGDSIEGDAVILADLSAPDRFETIVVNAPILNQRIADSTGEFIQLTIRAESPELDAFTEANIGTAEISLVDTMTMDILVLKIDGSPVIFAESNQETGVFPVECVALADSELSLGTAQVVVPEEDPEISVSPGSINFGTLEDGDNSTEAVTLTNVGGGLLSIDLTLNGDDAFSQTNDCDELSESESCTVDVTYTAVGDGVNGGTLVITSSDGVVTDVQLSGASEIIIIPESEIELSTDSINFGTLIAGLSSMESVTVSNIGDAALNISSITVDGDNAFSILSECGSVLDAGESCSVDVTYMADGVSNDSATLVISSDDSDEATSSVDLAGRSQLGPEGDIEVSTNSVDFGTVVTGNTVVQTVTVSNVGDADLNIDSVELAGSGVSAFMQTNDCTVVAVGDSCEIELTYSANGVSNDAADLIIMSDDTDEPSTIVNLTGESIDAPTPEISVSPASVSFGDVAPGVDSTRTVVVSNVGLAALTVTGISLNGDSEFIQSNDCGTVSVGGDCTVTLTFTPSGEASFSTELTITSDDLDTPSVTLNVTGEGKEAVVVIGIEVSFDVAGETYIAKAKGTPILSGSIDAVMDLVAGTYVASLLLDPTIGKFPLLGSFLGTAANIEFESVGDTTGTLSGGILTSNSEMYTLLPDVYLTIFSLQIRIGGGDECRTKDSSIINLTSPEGVFFDPLGAGGSLSGIYALSKVENCGFFNGLIGSILAGDENTITLNLTPAPLI